MPLPHPCHTLHLVEGKAGRLFCLLHCPLLRSSLTEAAISTSYSLYLTNALM